jgi:hypothetical protein
MEEAVVDDAPLRWTFRGPAVESPGPSWVTLVLAFLVGFETFVERGDTYPFYLSAAVIISAIWVVRAGIKKKALLALAGIPIAALWLDALIGGSRFVDDLVYFFVAHSLYALYLAVAGYTFMAYSRRKR